MAQALSTASATRTFSQVEAKPRTAVARVAPNHLCPGHRGIVAAKACARAYTWRPGMDSETERQVQDCDICQENSRLPVKAPVPHFEEASRPWQVLPLDFAGPVEGLMALVVMDSFTKWLEVRNVHSASSKTVIRELRWIFSTSSIPEKIVSDNGALFVSAEIKDFYKSDGITSD
ncbi:uncharacterized protein K02A2.6-like [Ornithodoros turicata]|uniref:uncharacterized protein K02A2.6-like n=1 Tax=Ornithodoros turicata TaxID=34597 RepID=UPI003138BA2C